MLRYSEAILNKLRKRLFAYSGRDRAEMIGTLETICSQDHSWNSPYHKYIEICQKALKTKTWRPTEEDVIQVCQQLKEKLDLEVADTTEKTLEAKNPATTEKSYTQLTLDFSATTEKNNTASLDGEKFDAPVATRREPRLTDEDHLICQKYNSQGKGWLAPQYKYFDEYGKSHTTTNPSLVSAAKIYGPYWTYRWLCPGKTDGNYYLGATKSKKFQHFSVVWPRCGDTTEILSILRG